MKDPVIGIIGGTGGMGRWFADLLQKDGHTVHICGRKTMISLDEVASLCSVVVVSVPIAATAEIIKKIAPLLPEDSLLMDLTSLKKEPVELMLAHSRAEVIGGHPLFGPAITDVRGQNFVLCPGRGENWLIWLKNILIKNGLNVLTKTPEEHDKMMAIVQVLNHLNTITLGLVLAETGMDIAEINKFATPIFQTKMEIVKKIFTESPELYADIIVRNPDTKKMIDLYEKTLDEISKLIDSPDDTQLKDTLQRAAKNLF